MAINNYSSEERIRKKVAAGDHRGAIGALWEQVGKLQMDFLKLNGLTPDMRLLDIGCGSLRLGVLAVDYLDTGNYFGHDLHQELFEAGYERELSAELKNKLPRRNLKANASFDFSFLPEPMDMAIAHSVFSHLPMNHIRHCLDTLHVRMAPRGSFFMTFFLCPSENMRQLSLVHEGLQKKTTSYSDPYHYTLRDLEFCAEDNGWEVEYIGEWGHPRGQHMAKFTRI